MTRIERRRGRRRSRALLSIVAILALVGGGYAVFRYGGALLPGGGGGGDIDFSFTVTKAVGVPTAPEVGTRDVADAAATVADFVAPVVTDLYRSAFLDPDAWSTGDYADAWALFSPEAQATALADVATLTLGADAATRFASISDPQGSLRIKVLFDADGVPTLVVASVRFEATATAVEGGTDTAVASRGRYFLRSVDGGWRIVAYVVDRADAPAVGAS